MPPELPRYPYVHVDVSAERAEALGAWLWERGALGLEERDASTLNPAEGASGQLTLVASFAEQAEAEAVLAQLIEHFPARLEHVVGDDWATAWKEYFHVTRIGQRLVIRPSWEPVEPWPEEVVLTIDPGAAFGSGIHETTRLVLREIDRRVRGGERILDVGCGSGILSIAALLLGASKARAVDVDPLAIEVSRENARANRVSSRLEVSTTPIERLRGSYDLVLANIQAPILAEMAGALRARLAPGGCLVLSGVLLGQQDALCPHFLPLHPKLIAREGEWVAIVLGAI